MQPIASAVERPVQVLFQAGLAIFVITVSIGIFNGFHFITLARQVLLTHVHAGTLGWITLGVLAATLWLFHEEGGATAGLPVRPLAAAMAVAVLVYVLAFLSGNFVLRAIFGVPVLALIAAFLWWLLAQSRLVRLTVPRLAIIAAVVTLTIASTIGVLVQIQLATKTLFLPAGAIGGHASMQVVGYLVLVGMALTEWRLNPETGRRLSRAGVVQVVLLFLGGLLVSLGALLDIMPLLGAFIPAEVVALAIYLVRVAPRLGQVRWLQRGSGRHFGIAIAFLVANVGLVIWLILSLVAFKIYTRFEDIPLWLFFAVDHSMFIGVMTNSLLGLLHELTHERRSVWPWADDIIFWGINGGMIGFVLTLITNQQALEKLFTPIMGGSILLAIVTFTLRLQARPAVRPLTGPVPAS
jgi:hypothetical protein